MTMIEQSDRGVTLNKQLAWTVACGLVGAGIWVGMQVAGLSRDTQQLSASINTLRGELAASEAREAALASRVRANETGLARQDERLSLILSALSKIDGRLERMERLPQLR